MPVPQPQPRRPREVVIDRRPLWRILFGRTYRPVVLAAGVLVFLLISTMETPEGLSPTGQKALAVFAICVVYWFRTCSRLMVTSLLAMVLITTTACCPQGHLRLFGNEAVFFILAASSWPLPS